MTWIEEAVDVGREAERRLQRYHKKLRLEAHNSLLKIRNALESQSKDIKHMRTLTIDIDDSLFNHIATKNEADALSKGPSEGRRAVEDCVRCRCEVIIRSALYEAAVRQMESGE